MPRAREGGIEDSESMFAVTYSLIAFAG